MGQRGTDVARDAGDIVLKDDAFETIVMAVRQGRSIFANIRRFVVFLLSGNLGQVLAISLAALLGAPLPLLPLQILYLNMLLDVFPALALGMGEDETSVMEQPPRDPDEAILTRDHWLAITAFGLVIAGSVLAAFAISLLVLDMEVAAAVTVS
jgi:Ca2+-transporting ATPase